MLEIYEEKETPFRAGAIDHIAFNCTDIEAAYQRALEQGYKIVSDGIEELPFWEHGVRYFIIEGPNGERLEWNQRI
jgi:predicted enzyme related to lactoylglutathione lyase